MDKETPSDSNQSYIRRLLHFIGLSTQPDTTEDLELEIQELIEEGEEQGLITSQEGQLISSIFEFRDTVIREIMTPATDIVSAPVTASADEIIKLITEKGFSRIPIYDESPDHIIGILHAKQLLICSTQETIPALGSLVGPVLFVRENDKIVTVLRDFQAQKKHMAVVTDEFGSIRGLVTLEDILEEIVGEIVDETDKLIEDWHVIDDHTIIVSAKVDIEKVESFFHLEFPEGPYESIGGFIIHQLDRIPESRETAEYGPLVFEILSASKRRIRSVKIRQKGK